MPYYIGGKSVYAYWAVAKGAATVNGKSSTKGEKSFIIDSGTSLIYAPPADAATFYAAIPGAKQCTTGAACQGATDLWQFPCASAVDAPDVAFSVAGGRPVKLGKGFNLGFTDQGSKNCVGALCAFALLAFCVTVLDAMHSERRSWSDRYRVARRRHLHVSSRTFSLVCLRKGIELMQRAVHRLRHGQEPDRLRSTSLAASITGNLSPSTSLIFLSTHDRAFLTHLVIPGAFYLHTPSVHTCNLSGGMAFYTIGSEYLCRYKQRIKKPSCDLGVSSPSFPLASPSLPLRHLSSSKRVRLSSVRSQREVLHRHRRLLLSLERLELFLRRSRISVTGPPFALVRAYVPEVVAIRDLVLLREAETGRSVEGTTVVLLFSDFFGVAIADVGGVFFLCGCFPKGRKEGWVKGRTRGRRLDG